METTTASSCQSTANSLRPRKNAKKQLTCAWCSKRFYGHHTQQRFCGRECSGKASNESRYNCAAKYQCAACHAHLGISGKGSAELLGMSKCRISAIRISLGLPRLPKSVASQRARQRIKLARPPGEQLKDWANEQWKGVVEEYWGTVKRPEIVQIMIERGCHYGVAAYYANHEQEKERCREKAKVTYAKALPGSNLRLRKKVRNHVCRLYILSGTRKHRKTREHLGADIPTVRKWLERQFRPGMTWENHGSVWEIDHILPLSKFDLTKPEHRLRASHFTNLQPLFKYHNRAKGAKFTGTHQLALL